MKRQVCCFKLVPRNRLQAWGRSALVQTLAAASRPLVARPRPAQPQRVVIIKPDHLGDIVLLTPALAALRATHPQAWIAALVGPWARRLLIDNPNLDAVLTCPFPGFVRGERVSALEPYQRLLHYALLLRAGAFDTAIIARDDHWWGGLLALIAGIPRRIGFAHALLAPTLTDALPWNAGEHVTHQALALVATLTDQPIGQPPTVFYPAAADQQWAQTWQQQHSPDRPLIAIQPGSGGAAKLWPGERWAAVARHLAAHGTLVLTGGPDDLTVVHAISEQLETAHHKLAGHTSLGQLAALFGRCELVLGVDNGPLHLAVAQGTPTIHLFGPSDHGRFGPWGDPVRHRVVRSGLWCSPCGVLSHCPRNTHPSECMTTITVEMVIGAAHQILSGAASA